MRLRPLLVLALLAAATPAAAAKQQAPDEDGILFGLRGGFGLPYGDLSRDAALKDLVQKKLPLWLEVGYRFNGHFHSTLYFELAPMSLAECPKGSACSAFDVRFGLLLQLHMAPRHWIDPWLGLGFGIEHLQATAPPTPGAPDAFQLTWDGLELPVEAGLDLAVTDFLTFGPYASASAGQFTSASQRPPGGSTARGSVQDRATHGWVQAGLRLTLRL
jgi:hypothetical protein